ncbi:MAG: quinoprotein dehydrogenase-associated putative ABC transporter substrate-binding protein [Rhodobacteraceae bacterium]|nr:MAG: quinoprotein dehydrogenase-associated putative ABC transporter substrate-binding protein [Paracoccaceae bacterium]
MPAWAAEGRAALVAAALALFAAAPAAARTADLVSDTQFRVCADPANLPFSHREGGGFENRIAELFAAELGRPVAYTWYPQATGFIRRTLGEKRCDVIIGYSQGHELVLNTNHYYTSAFVFLTRADGPLAGVDTISDPRLQGRRLGVVAGSPPADHLARHGLIGRAKPYALMVDRRYDDPSAQMVDDMRAGEIDGAFVWGPIGGWLAKTTEDIPLVATPLLNEPLPPRLFYRITMGVRAGEDDWKRELNALIRRKQTEIDAILTEFGVPLVDEFGRAVITQ